MHILSMALLPPRSLCGLWPCPRSSHSLCLSPQRVFPYISAMVNNGSLTYDHSKDGRGTELAGCSADLRNQNHDTFLAVRYSRGRLTVRPMAGQGWLCQQLEMVFQAQPLPLWHLLPRGAARQDSGVPKVIGESVECPSLEILMDIWTQSM